MFARISHPRLHLLSPCAAQYLPHFDNNFNPPPPLPTQHPCPTTAGSARLGAASGPRCSFPITRPTLSSLCWPASVRCSEPTPPSSRPPQAGTTHRLSIRTDYPHRTGPRCLEPTPTPTARPAGHRLPAPERHCHWHLQF
jgi:hypothetical protein